MEAFNRGGKAGMDEMLKRDGWLVGGGFFKQMRPDGQGKLHPVQTIPIAQIRHYVSGLVDPQTHQPVSDIDSAIGGQAGASRVSATPGGNSIAPDAARSESRLINPRLICL